MKKYLLAALLMAAPSFVTAQLTVDSIGNVRIKATEECEHADLAVGYDPSYIAGDFHLFKMGIHSMRGISANRDYNVGVYSEIFSSFDTNNTNSVGVWGIAGGATNGRNYGVMGGLHAWNGAGIVGANHSGGDITITGKYAGYFDGPTYCNSTVTATSFITPSDITLKENILPLADSKAPSATLNRVLGMNVISYNYKDKGIPEAERDTISPELAKVRYSVEKNRHYGLSAQELQAIYPDLVYKGQDGTLGVNYVELVPILIQSIQELNEKIELMNAEKGCSENKTLSVSEKTADLNAAATDNLLYQNTPNPFKEQTTIRFRLADEATNAAICIFDMSGKMLKKLPVSLGMTSVTINGYELGEGLYLYSLIVNGREIDTKRMILSK